MRRPAIDMTVLRIEILGDELGDAAAHDRLRAHRVVDHIRRRFPAVRYNDAPEDFEDDVGRRVLDEAGERKVL
jgi:hypothetical protein